MTSVVCVEGGRGRVGERVGEKKGEVCVCVLL